MTDRPLCTGTTAAGGPCRAGAKGSTGRCRLHQVGNALTLALAQPITTPAQLRAVLLTVARGVGAGEVSAHRAEQIRIAAREAYDMANPPATEPPAPARTSGPLLDVAVLLSGKPPA